MSMLTMAHAHRQRDERSFLLQRAQPAMTGLIDGAIIATVSAAPGGGQLTPEPKSQKPKAPQC
jgi:hypothetical protein